ncbi:Homoserine/homoserine lactone efflux protein [Ephemeroptericola cinctiostellae]|uniref:Homoserine/homoserine lactone efflux protein n=1 Tax=Ephemeroptericola cinctiostellae TaxID=2268024 RepID=A0A345D9F5_9BURK|nr:LysE family translocator [Ephemeroptericola cinctiostellae]AXF84993.1 Homoserine/homoserine lactone efflux protein [Ephemeroptericola cinctiostellae]
MTPEFLLTTFIIVASPGTGAIYTLAAGLSRGAKASVFAAFACTLGILPHLAAALLGLAALLHASAVAFNAIKYAGIVYLLYMAWHTLRETGALNVSTEHIQHSNARILMDGVLLNILNPKLSIFFVAFLPQFISSQEIHPLFQMAELSGVFMLMTFIVFSMYGVLAASMRDHVVSRPNVMMWMRRSFAAAFGALAVKLALTERT